MKNWTVADIEREYPQAVFVDNTQDVMAVKENIGKKAEGFFSFFVLVGDGEYLRVWGLRGIIPWSTRPVELIYGKEPTKAELIAEIAKIGNEYLGFQSGFSWAAPSWNKAKIQARLEEFRKMIELHREAKNITSKYNSEDLMWYAIKGGTPDDLKRAHVLMLQANNIWLGGDAGDFYELFSAMWGE